MGSGDRLRIAVVEDDDDLLRLFGDLFADAGFVVTLASSPESLATSWSGDVIVTGSGAHTYERAVLLRRLQCLRSHGNPRIVLVSAHSEAARDAAALGPDAFVPTPFEIDELVRTVRTVARRSR